MRRLGGVTMVVLAAIGGAACGVGGGADVRSPAVGDTTTTTKAPTTTTTRPEPEVDPMPWEDVLAALDPRAGHVERETMAIRPGDSGGAAADGFSFREVIDFDQDRRVVLRDITGATQQLALPEGPLRMFTIEDRSYFSTFWLGPKCGSEWVRVDASTGPVIPALFDDGSSPLEPLRSLTEATPELLEDRVTVSLTVWRVDLPATDALPLGFEHRYPEVWKELSAQTVPAEVDAGGGSGLGVAMTLPSGVLAAAGAVEAGAVPDGADLQSFWRLNPLDGDDPVPMSEPEQVAADGSCVLD